MDKAKERAKDVAEKILDATDNYYEEITDRLAEKLNK